MNDLMFYLAGVLSGLVIAFMLGVFCCYRDLKKQRTKVATFWEKRLQVDERMIEVLWEIRRALIDLRGI